MQTTQLFSDFSVAPVVIMLQCTQCGRYADEINRDTSIRCSYCRGKVNSVMVLHPAGAVLVVCEVPL